MNYDFIKRLRNMITIRRVLIKNIASEAVAGGNRSVCVAKSHDVMYILIAFILFADGAMYRRF